MVLKASKNTLLTKTIIFQLLKTTQIATYFADLYNSRLDTIKSVPQSERVFFTRVLVTKFKKQFCLLEAYIPGKFDKYTNNREYVNENVPLLTAFSHFTYQLSDGKYMVADLQGVNNLLTDSVVHTRQEKFSKLGDLGSVGMVSFFRFHECNKYCKILNLKPHEAQQNRVQQVRKEPVTFNVSKFYTKCGFLFCNANAMGNRFCQTCEEKMNLTELW